MDNLSTILDIWQSRNLTLLGRVLLTKCIGILQLVYSITILDTPSEYIKATNSLLFKFIWKKKRKTKLNEKYCLLIIVTEVCAPNIELMSNLLKLDWITRLLTKEQPWEEAWKTIPNYFFNKYGGLNFLLKCNYNEKFLRQINLPHFYKSMLQHFLEVKVAYICAIGQDLVLFDNKEILIENQTIFYKEWFQKGIFLFQDLLHENSQLLTFQEFIQRYDVECNFLKCVQVVSAIPEHLLDKAREK